MFAKQTVSQQSKKHMAYQKKQYRSVDARTNRAQTRGGGMTTRLNKPHRYPTRPINETSPGMSPTYLKATEAKKLKV